jgi:hypothetical protein
MPRSCGALDRATECAEEPPRTRQDARIADNQIHDNSSSAGGGGIRFCYFYGTLPRPAFERNVISGNTSAEGGGVLCYEADSLEARECVIAGNVATLRGGGLLSSADTMTPALSMRRCTLHGNRAPDDVALPTGGGIYVQAGELTLRSTIVSSNAGGGLVCDAAAPGPTIDSDYDDVWNNGLYDYSACSPGPHDISADPFFCEDVPTVPPWYCIFETSPCNGTGWQGEDIGAGWVACYSQPWVVFYDNFSDQSDDGWTTEEGWPDQIRVEEGEYSMESASGSARASVSELAVEHLECTAWFRPLDTQMGGETHAYFRMTPESETWYELIMETETQRGTLLRVEGGLICIMAEFDCPQYVDAWHKLTLTATGSRLTGTLEIPFGMIVPLFDMEDPLPLSAGTIGFGVAWRSAPGLRGAQHTHFDRIMVRRLPDPADVAGADDAPARPPFARASPNPTRGAVSFTLRATGPACVELFDVAGRLVRSLRTPAAAVAGADLLRLDWDGRDSSGRPVASGVYTWRLTANAATPRAMATGRLVLMR